MADATVTDASMLAQTRRKAERVVRFRDSVEVRLRTPNTPSDYRQSIEPTNQNSVKQDWDEDQNARQIEQRLYRELQSKEDDMRTRLDRGQVEFDELGRGYEREESQRGESEFLVAEILPTAVAGKEDRSEEESKRRRTQRIEEKVLVCVRVKERGGGGKVSV